MIDPKKIFPQVDASVQLFFAAIVWLIGAGMILRLAMIYLAQVGSEHWWIPPLGLLLGLLKAYFLMIPSAAKTIERIREQGRSWLFNSYAPRVYLLVGGMIALGVSLRLLGPTDVLGYQMFLAVLYLTIGVGMFISDGVFLAALRKGKARKKANSKQ
ncbi:MAG: hypothetical protein FWE48_02270 [Coriobacteriia bacterium]|nr:hypothetical protein [Coriobacteriia bacterium]MCL2745907.1 hypothetical protein [Coriobacteriia bacterium]MCL2870825.1 hypothetical protein [Coriobacteriia bacterium]